MSTFFAPSTTTTTTTSAPKLGTPALNSLLYDPATYRQSLRQSVGPGQYVLTPVTPSCRPCLALDPRVAVGTSGVAACDPGRGGQSLVDVESDLHNLTRPATHDPRGLYRGDGGAPVVCASSLAPPACDGIPAVDTRLNNPPCTLRGTGWNRFEWLCQDPQQRALMPFDAYIDTAIVVKDNHRPFLARPVDQTLALPPGKDDRDATVGAPRWIPKLCNGVGPVDEPPQLIWRSKAEVDVLTRGAQG